jgi:hypothetical protein
MVALLLLLSDHAWTINKEGRRGGCALPSPRKPKLKSRRDPNVISQVR